MFTKQTIDAIRESADIVEIVSEVVELKTWGDKHKGLCPFHNESTPSFSVSNGLYFCFGCLAGGDVIRFIQATQSLTFGDAVRHLADRYSVPLDDSQPMRVPRPKKRPLPPMQMPDEWIPPPFPFVATYDPVAALHFERLADCTPPAFTNLLLTLGIVPNYLVLELSEDVGMSNLSADRYVPNRQPTDLLQERAA